MWKDKRFTAAEHRVGQEGGTPSVQARKGSGNGRRPPKVPFKNCTCNTFIVFAVRSCLSVGYCCRCYCCVIVWLTSHSVFTQPSSTCRFCTWKTKKQCSDDHRLHTLIQYLSSTVPASTHLGLALLSISLHVSIIPFR